MVASWRAACDVWRNSSASVLKMSSCTFSSRSRKRATSTGTILSYATGRMSPRDEINAASTLADARRTFQLTSSSSP